MTRTAILAEIARIENARPTFGAFLAGRVARLAELRAALPTATDPAEAPRDEAVEAQIERFDASSPRNRARARWA